MSNYLKGLLCLCIIYMFDNIIPIGEACNITFLLQNAKIKKQTTLFEWFASPNLKDITDILVKIGNNTDENIIMKKVDNIFIGDNIYSSHYTFDSFKDIYQRRRNRLVDIILSSKRLLCCRFEVKRNVYTKEDIDNFINSILTINKNIEDIKLFLITPGMELEHPSLIKVIFTEEDPFSKSKKLNDLFINSLENIGYDVNDKTDIPFTDISDN